MKKIILLMLVGLMTLAGSALTFAEVTGEEENSVRGEKSQRVELSKEERRAKVVELFEIYNGDALTDFNAVNEAHRVFHEASRTEREILKAAMIEQREVLKAQLDNGELTKEEVQVIVKETKFRRQEIRSDIQSILEQKRADAAVNQEKTKGVRTAIRSQLQEEIIDGAQVASLLDQLVTLLEEHVEIDQLYYNMVHDLGSVL